MPVIIFVVLAGYSRSVVFFPYISLPDRISIKSAASACDVSGATRSAESIYISACDGGDSLSGCSVGSGSASPVTALAARHIAAITAASAFLYDIETLLFPYYVVQYVYYTK